MTTQYNAARSRLGIEYPIIQGPFGGGLSTIALAAIVSQLGGLGSFGAHMLAPAQIGPLVSDLRAHTDRPFAVNLWVSDHDAGGFDLNDACFERAWAFFAPHFQEMGLPKPQRMERGHPVFSEQIEALLEAAPPVFSFVFGVPSKAILDACRHRGIVTIGAATTISEALALQAAGVDLIVASGAEAGGHRPSFLAPAETSLCGTFSLVQLIARRVSVPVIAAGGISDAQGIRAALALGAQAAQIGTAFLACEESAASALHRDLLFTERSQHTLLTRAFSGRLARGMRNRWTDEIANSDVEFPPFPVTSWFISKLRAASIAAGNTDFVSLWSGQIAPNLQHRSATLLMESLICGLQKNE